MAPAGIVPLIWNVAASGFNAIVSGPGFGIAISASAGGLGLPKSPTVAALPLTAPPLGGVATFFSCAPAPATTNAPTTAQPCNSFFIIPSQPATAGARRLTRADAML